MTDPASCVLFLGQTGTNKKSVEASLNAEVERVSRAAGVEPSQRWETFQFERHLRPGMMIQDFTQLFRGGRQKEWELASERLLQEFDASQAAHRAVFLHGYYWYNGELFTHVVLDSLRKLVPSLIITLIDDVTDVHSRINTRELTYKTTAVKLGLNQVLTWRWAEIGLGDLIARNVGARPLPHFVVAVKHSASTLRQLILERERLPVYASFPISKTRRASELDLAEDRRSELRRQINDFRARLRTERFTVLDPLMIDEWLFESDETLERWPISELVPMVPPEEQPAEETSRQLADAGVRAALEEEISTQVSRRDFRMIDASTAVACFRPSAFDGRHSGGTYEELRYAQTTGRAILGVHIDAEDGGPYSRQGGPFDQIVTPSVYGSTDGLIGDLVERQNRRTEWFRRGEPQEWTSAAGSVLPPLDS